jgi:2-isopropylmalate synthase
MTQQQGFQLYDTTLRDGMQQEGMALSVDDKLAVARHLARLGVGFIEGGWPGAIPRDTAFFARARTELSLGDTQLVAFGATRRPDLLPWTDPQVAALLSAQTPVVTLVAKSHPRHVTAALRTTLAENLSMVDSTVRFLVGEGRRVFLDAEHFFDGFRADPRYAIAVVETAAAAGAEVVVLCDTNGGLLPDEIGEVVVATAAATGVRLGIHCHDDTGCAVANSLAAVAAGVDHVQATAHGYGERSGNANLFSLAANLGIKQGVPVLSTAQLASMSTVAAAISEVTSVPSRPSAPYVGSRAFTHKAGLHAAALRVDPDLYQHIRPERVGNAMRTLVSDQGGRSSVALKAQELGYPVPAGALARVAARVKELENAGYSFESADASFILLLREEMAEGAPPPFTPGSWSVAVRGEPDRPSWCVADVEVLVDALPCAARGEASTPVGALDRALHAALEPHFPALARLRLTGHEVRVLDTTAGVRVRLSFVDGDRGWSTVAVDADQVAAAWNALTDAAAYALVHAGRHALDLVPAGAE